MNPNLASSSLTELASSWEPILAATFDRLLKLAHTLKPSTSLLGTPESSSDLSSPPVSNSNIFIHYLSPSQVIPIIHCVFFFFFVLRLTTSYGMLSSTEITPQVFHDRYSVSLAYLSKYSNDCSCPYFFFNPFPKFPLDRNDLLFQKTSHLVMSISFHLIHSPNLGGGGKRLAGLRFVGRVKVSNRF